MTPPPKHSRNDGRQKMWNKDAVDLTFQKVMFLKQLNASTKHKKKETDYIHYIY